MPTFIFFRHGEAEHNVAYRTQGESAYTDPKYANAPLTAHGAEQVRAAAKALKAVYPNFHSITTSPLLRCIQTASILAEELKPTNTRLSCTYNLIERQGGGHICNVHDDIRLLKLARPDIRYDWTMDSPRPKDRYLEPMETDAAVAARAKQVISPWYWSTISNSTPVLLVTHHEVISSMFGKSVKNAECHVITQ